MITVAIILSLGAWFALLLACTCRVQGHDLEPYRMVCRRCMRTAEWIVRFER